jgi:hypothetical protein
MECFSVYSLLTEVILMFNLFAFSDEDIDNELVLTLKLLDQILASSLANKYNQAVFLENYEDVIDFCLQVGGNAKLKDFVREASFGLLSNLIEQWPLGLVENDTIAAKLVTIIDASFKLCADPSDRSLNPHEFSSQNIATQLLDVLTSNLKNSSKANPAQLIAEKAKSILNDANSSEDDKKAASVALAVLPEANTAYSKSILSEILPLLIKSVGDKSNVVRAAAFLSLAEYIEHLQPEIGHYTDNIVNLIISAISNKEEDALVQAKAAIPLIQITGHIEAKSVENAQDNNNLINQIINLVQTQRKIANPNANIIDLLESLLLALQKFAGNKQGFPAYQEKIFTLVLEILNDSTAPAEARAAAAATIGEIAEKQGKTAINSVLKQVAPAFLAATTVKENYAVKAAVYAAWSSIADALGGEIKPFVKEFILANLTEILDSQYPVEEPEKKDKKGKAKVVLEGDGDEEEEEEEEEDEEDDEDEEYDPDEEGANLNETKLEVQQNALSAYQSLITALGPEFIDYNNEFFGKIFDGAGEYTEENKQVVAQILSSFTRLYPVQKVENSNAAKTNPVERDRNKPWTAGENLALPAPALELFGKAKQVLLSFIHYGAEPDTVITSLDALTALTLTYGQIITQDDKNTEKTAVNLISKILKDKASCQSDFEPDLFGFGGDEEDEEDEENEEEEEEEEEGEEEDEEGGKGEKESKHVHSDACEHSDQDDLDSLKTSALDLLCALARVRGAAFSEQFKSIYPTLLKSTKTEDLFGYTFGCFPDFQDCLGSASFTDYAKEILPQAIKRLHGLQNAAMGRNISYAVGAILLKGGSELAEFFDSAAANLIEFTKEVQSQVAVASAREEKAQAESKASYEAPESYTDLLAALDNSVSAIGKLLMVSADKLKEDKRDEAVKLFFSNLPLKSDFDESNYAYSAAIKLISAQPSLVQPYAKGLTNIFYTLLQAPNVEEKEAQSSNSPRKNEFRLTEKLRGFLVKGTQGLLSSELLKPEAESAINEWPAEKKEKFQSQVKA